jgi:hypothetical protein
LVLNTGLKNFAPGKVKKLPGKIMTLLAERKAVRKGQGALVLRMW